ncbi:MAG: hypothetical protein IT577_23385 [Verrucomicrobiae bacterium]|nr:hypothetical protein [Verrucomicrobiae bacterium]
MHPQRKALASSVKDDKVLGRPDDRFLLAVGIDDQVDGRITGRGYKGPPMHAISLFANPLLADRGTQHTDRSAGRSGRGVS